MDEIIMVDGIMLTFSQLSHKGYGADLTDLRNIDEETAISYINRFGKTLSDPFVEKRTPLPRQRQLMVLVEGYEAEKAPQSFKDVLSKSEDHFQVSNPPSSVANIFLMADLNAVGASTLNWCSVSEAMYPEGNIPCWSGNSVVMKYDAQKVRAVLSVFRPTGEHG